MQPLSLSCPSLVSIVHKCKCECELLFVPNNWPATSLGLHPASLLKRQTGNTYGGAAHEDNYEGSDNSTDANEPGHPEEKDDAKDVLDAGQVDAHQRAELGDLPGGGHNRCWGQKKSRIQKRENIWRMLA